MPTERHFFVILAVAMPLAAAAQSFLATRTLSAAWASAPDPILTLAPTPASDGTTPPTLATASPPGPQPVPTPTEGILPMAPESYVDVGRIWKAERRPIPVCWEPSAIPGIATGKAWVEQAIHEVFEDVTVVRFAGTPGKANRWPTCSAQSLGIRITITTQRPRSLVGQRFEKAADGTRVEVPTRMSLNFGTGPYTATCGNQRKACTRYLAAHEFAHAIGFLHEHLRDDAPAICKAQYAHEADDPGYQPSAVSVAFDPSSITNYCTHIFKNPMPVTSLSALDITAVNHFYATQ